MDKQSGSSAFLALLTIILSMVLEPIVQGLVLQQMWQWFVVETFGAPALLLPQAIGINLLVALFLIGVHRRENPFKDTKSGGEILAVFLGLLAVQTIVPLAFGWIVHSFI